MAALPLPAGFRFHPSDQELVVHYLQTRATGELDCHAPVVTDLDVYKYNPWALPSMAAQYGNREWYFFTPRERKYGLRPSRTAPSGFWKATGTDKVIALEQQEKEDGNHPVAVKKTLVFYVGRPPAGTKTPWIMHEYRLLTYPNASSTMGLVEWVLCRIMIKGGAPPPPPPVPVQDIQPALPAAGHGHGIQQADQLMAPPTGNNNGMNYGYAPEDLIQNNNDNNLEQLLLDQYYPCESHLNAIEGQGQSFSDITGVGEFTEADELLLNSVTNHHHPQSISDSDQQIGIMDLQQDFFN